MTTIKSRRESLGLTQRTVSYELGIAVQSYSKLERGASSVADMAFARGLKLAEILQITPAELLKMDRKKTS